MTPYAHRTFHKHPHPDDNVEGLMVGCPPCRKHMERAAHKRHLPATLDTCNVCQRLKKQEQPVGQMTRKERKRLRKEQEERERLAKAASDAITKKPEEKKVEKPVRFTEEEAKAAFLMLATVDDGEFLREPLRVLFHWASNRIADAWERAGRTREGEEIKPANCPNFNECALTDYYHPAKDIPCKKAQWVIDRDNARAAANKAKAEARGGGTGSANFAWSDGTTIGFDATRTAEPPVFPAYDNTWNGHDHTPPVLYHHTCPRCSLLREKRLAEIRGKKEEEKLAPQTSHQDGCDCRACNWETLSAAQDRAEDPDVQGYSVKQGPVYFVKDMAGWTLRHQRANRTYEGPKIVGPNVMLTDSVTAKGIYEFKSNVCGHMWVARGIPSEAIRCPAAQCADKKTTSTNVHYVLPTDTVFEMFMEWEKEYFGRGGGPEALLPKELKGNSETHQEEILAKLEEMGQADGPYHTED